MVSSLAIKISKDILLPNFGRVNFGQISIDIKQDGSWVTIADTQVHQMLTQELPKLIDYPVLSEEMVASEQQAILNTQPQNYWCIDPLDGTSNFTQGIPYWCMSVALIEDGKMKLGVVYDPNRDECFTASDLSETCLNGRRLNQPVLSVVDLKNCIGLIDFKRLDTAEVLALVSDPPYRSQRSFGASALDFCWIAAKRCHIYLHGKQKLWDYAAGLLILKNANGFAETFNGKDLFANDLKHESVIAACDLQLMEQWKEYFHSIKKMNCVKIEKR